MKKFLSIISFQDPNRFYSYNYEAKDNQLLSLGKETHFPIIAEINGYCSKGDEIRVIALAEDNDNSRKNAETLNNEVMQICAEKGIQCAAGVELIIIPTDDSISSQIDTFQRLIDTIDDDDELYICMTYGTKPKSSTLILSAQYAYRIKHNVSICCVAYGQVDRSNSNGDRTKDKASIFDMTALTMLDEMIRVMASQGVRNPRALIETVLSM